MFTNVVICADGTHLRAFRDRAFGQRLSYVFISAYTWDHPETVEWLCSLSTHVQVGCRVLVDCEQSTKVKGATAQLQQLLSCGVGVRTAQGRPLDGLYGGSYRGRRGNLHAKMALAFYASSL